MNTNTTTSLVRGFLALFLTVSVLATQVHASTFVDSFDQPLSNWTQMPSSPSASWTLSGNGHLRAFYTTDAGSTANTQADLLLNDAVQPSGDFVASAVFSYVANRQYGNLGNATAVFSVYESAGRKQQIYLGYSAWNWFGGTAPQLHFGVQTYSPWSAGPVGGAVPITWDANAWHMATLRRAGATYTLYFDGTLIEQWQDTFLSGGGKLGLHVYGDAIYDSFAVTTDINDTALTGAFDGLLNGMPFVVEVGIDGRGARFTTDASTETLAFIGSDTHSLYFWREADKAAFSIHLQDGSYGMTYLKGRVETDVELTRSSSAPSIVPVGALGAAPAPNPYEGQWTGQVAPSAFDLSVTASSAVITFSGRSAESLAFVGYDPATGSIYYFRAQDEAVLALTLEGEQYFAAYLEADNVRIAPMTRVSASHDDCAALEAALEAVLAAAQADLAAAQSAVAALDAERAQLQLQLAAAHADKAQLADQVAALTAEIDRLLAQLVTKQNEIDILASQVTALSVENTDLRQQLTAIRGCMSSELEKVRMAIASALKEPSFLIPGSDDCAKLEWLATRMTELPPGQLKGMVKP